MEMRRVVLGGTEEHLDDKAVESGKLWHGENQQLVRGTCVAEFPGVRGGVPRDGA